MRTVAIQHDFSSVSCMTSSPIQPYPRPIRVGIRIQAKAKWWIRIVGFATLAMLIFSSLAKDGYAQTERAANTDQSQVAQVVRQSFAATHKGFSSDEVILKTELNDAFIKECSKRLPSLEPSEFNWSLLNLRKAGKLNTKTTKRDYQNFDKEIPVAEICSRTLEDKHGVSIDRIMASPAMRDEFDQLARSINGSIDLYLVRKAAFRLRKARQLRPELINRIADWGRKVDQHFAQELKEDFDVVPKTAGIYIFLNTSGYLYVGEAKDLRARLKQHFVESENQSLANYLNDEGLEGLKIEIHSFEQGSRIDELRVRRAYESELIRSRKPKFNIRP